MTVPSAQPSTDRLIVQTQRLRLTLPPEGFAMSNGEFLPELHVAYETYGTLNAAGDNAVYICHALTGDAHAAGYHDVNDAKPGWWDPLIGPGKGVDTNRFFVVCANILGGCKGTTGPASIDPRTGNPYGARFPLITIKDVVNVQKCLVDQLGVKRLYAVLGGSLGGMMALEWALAYPDFVERCVCVASSVNLTPLALAFDIIGRQEIEHDPNWLGGDYIESATSPSEGLSRARQIGHVTYLSPQGMANKFGREKRDVQIRPSKFSTNFQIESYLDYQGKKFVDRFDANSYLYITRMMDMFDLAQEYGTLERAFARVKSRCLVVSISSDWLFPPSQQLEIVRALIANRKPVSYFQLDSPDGHDAFLIEYGTMNKGISAFLAEPTAIPEFKPAPQPVEGLDQLAVSDLIDAGSHVLDVGSGDGAMMLSLMHDKGITGACLDKDFSMVVACMRHGLPALQLDADSGLSLIAGDAFDTVLLNQTIQQLNSPLQTVKQMLRIAPSAVIGFPNFAYYAYRLSLIFGGRLPVSDLLPYQWYDTPNIHLVTVHDFEQLCRKHNVKIDALRHAADSAIGRTLIRLGLPNLGAERSLTRISRLPKSTSDA